MAFIVYPEVVSRLPVSPLWAIMFFMMLITLGMGTQFSVVCTVHTTLLDVFPKMRRGARSTLLMVGLCCCGFFLGLICTTNVRDRITTNKIDIDVMNMLYVCCAGRNVHAAAD